MGEAIDREIPCDVKTSLIKIYSYENHNFYGTFQAPILGEEKKFKNLTQLILMLINLLDETNLLGALANYDKIARSRPKKSRSESRITKIANKHSVLRKLPIATFKVKVIFQLYGSWQGTITWTEKNKEQHFRSALEMIMLMNGALKASDPKTEIPAVKAANAV